jgi:hypothetical protein
VGFLEKPHTMTGLEMLLASVAQHAHGVKAAPAAGYGHDVGVLR